jgi:hypothetical protein
MGWQRRTMSKKTSEPDLMLGNIHDWILSLPWVVERPYGIGVPGVRSFAVDCEPLDLRQLWLVTGLTGSRTASALGAAVIVPTQLAEDLETVGLAVPISPMPARRVLARIPGDANRLDVEFVIAEAYASVMS